MQKSLLFAAILSLACGAIAQESSTCSDETWQKGAAPGTCDYPCREKCIAECAAKHPTSGPSGGYGSDNPAKENCQSNCIPKYCPMAAQ